MDSIRIQQTQCHANLWNYRGKNLMEDRLLMQDLLEEDFNIKPTAGRISLQKRQWIQVEKAVDKVLPCRERRVKAEMDKWVFPLHFIDFETSTWFYL
jgi:hypothetical protein